MIKKFCIAILVLFCSCKQNESEQKITSQKEYTSKIDTLKSNNASNYNFYPNLNWLKNIPKDTIAEMYWKEMIKRDSLNKQFKIAFANSFPLKDKAVIFLKEGKKYKSIIDLDYCHTISEPERAALGYIAMSYGTLNYCYYKDEVNEQYTMRNALKLDNECSDKFINYLQFWFRNDNKSLDEIKNNCHKTSIHQGSSVYFYYSRITLKIKENKIYINFKAEGSSRSDWDVTWTENLTFLVVKDYIKLIESKKSNEEYVYYYPNGSGIDPPKGYKNNGHGEYRLPKKKK